MKSRAWSMVALTTALAACSLPGCRDNTGNPAEIPDERSATGFIAFVGAGPADGVWPVLKAGAERYVASGSALGVRFFLPDSNAPIAQANLLSQLRDPDLRGVCIHLNDPEAVAPALTHLQRRGIPIVSMVEPAPVKNRAGHVGLDESAVGQQLARCTGESLGEQGGTIMVLHAGNAHPVYGARYLAFSEQIKFESRITVLRDLNCHADPREARQIIEETSARYPRLTAWVALQDWPLADGYPADKLFRPGIRYITVGGLPRQWPLVQSGLCPCVLGADYSAIGGRALQFCQSAVRNPSEEEQIFHIPLRPVTKATLEQYEEDWRQWAQAPGQTSSTTTSSAAGN